MDILQLKTTLKNDIRSVQSDYGALTVKSYSVPKGINEVCFVDLNEEISSGLRRNYLEIADSIDDNLPDNMFFLGPGRSIKDSADFGDIKVGGPHWVCYDVIDQKVGVKIEGKGNYVLVVEDFIKTVSIPANSGEFEIISFKSYPGLSLTVPAQSGAAGSQITFAIDTESGEESLSDKLIINSPITEWSPPLELRMPLDGRACTSGLVFGPDDLIPDCSEPGLLLYRLSHI